MGRGEAQLNLGPRWAGQPGRLEVWYATLSDPVSGIGAWVHHELVAPPGSHAFLHGWAALFSRDGDPVAARFGPEPATAPLVEVRGAAASLDVHGAHGRAGVLGWDLWWTASAARPLATFPAWAWRREILPAAQIVPIPSTAVSGELRHGDDLYTLSPATRGAVAHIYGHGNAERWGWLHAELGGGDVLEVVAPVGRRPGLRALRPLPFVALRLAGRDWPRDPLLAAPRFRAQLGLPRWRVHGTWGRRRLDVQVEMAPERCVTLDYTDPDGAPAKCTNSEVADADVVVEERDGGIWRVAHRWQLRGTAHAEIGGRPVPTD